MKIHPLTLIVLFSISCLIGITPLHAEDQDGPPPPPPGDSSHPRGNPEEFKKKMLERFDTNKDGELDETEKAEMKADMEKHRGKGPHHGGPGKPSNSEE